MFIEHLLIEDNKILREQKLFPCMPLFVGEKDGVMSDGAEFCM
jgi:hypothetical protein